MTKNKIIALLSGLVLVLGTCTLLSFDDHRDFEITKNLDIYYTLFNELNANYVDKIDPAKLIKTSIDKMLESLDPYTNYIPESKMEDYKFMTTGQYGGVGAMIRRLGDSVVISETYEGFPMAKSGVVPGDYLLSIDGKSCIAKTTEDISEMLKGQPGTSFVAKIKKGVSGEIIEKTIVREKITIPSVPYHGMLSATVGYIVLTGFTENASSEVRTALLDLKSKGATSLVFDLRENPGGLLNESVQIANLFVDKGQEIVSTRGKNQKDNAVYETQEPALDKTMPIAVLVNRGSASASEIVSGSLQDLDRAVIVGQRTFGKGLVQTTRDISYGTKLKVTIAKYYIPSGRCIQALDYTHRNADGSVGKVPDSLITEFKTKNGRSVYDGGGIKPDVEMTEPEVALMVGELVNQNMFFNFVTSYKTKHATIADPSTFVVSDELMSDFEKYVKSRKFSYKTDTEEDLENLQKTAETESYKKALEADFSLIKEKIEKEKAGDFERNSKIIKELLGQEIIERYYFQKGRIQYMLRDDPEVQKAVSVVSDQKEYTTILTAKANSNKK